MSAETNIMIGPSRTWRQHWQLTLGEDEVIGLDEVAKGVLGELVNVGVTLSRGEAGKSGENAVGEALVQHCVSVLYVYRWCRRTRWGV